MKSNKSHLNSDNNGKKTKHILYSKKSENHCNFEQLLLRQK